MAKKRMLYFTGITVGIILVIVLALVLFYNDDEVVVLAYNQIEDKMTEAAKNYTQNKPSILPNTDDEEVILTVNDLVTAGYMSPLNEYLGSSNSKVCTGEVKIVLTSETYKYTSMLDCGENYKTKLLYEVILGNVVSSGSGLYQMIDNRFTYANYANDSDNIKYIFRGEKPKNYLKLGDNYWLIVEVDSDNNLLLIRNDTFSNGYNYVWDDRYNTSADNFFGINDFGLSRIHDNLINYYADIADNVKDVMLPMSLCIGSRGIEDSASDYGKECNKKIENEYVGLMNASQFVAGSIDKDCASVTSISCGNYNYLTSGKNAWWLLTSDKDTTYSVYFVAGSSLMLSQANKGCAIRPMILVSSSLIFESGDGSKNNPYIVR